LLKDKYRPMRVSRGPESLAAFERACDDAGVRCSRVEGRRIGSAQAAVEIDGRRVEITNRLNAGTSRDLARQVWIYFGWDPQASRVVVGWLPTHLRSTTSSS
jgi:hypothetical protein